MPRIAHILNILSLALGLTGCASYVETVRLDPSTFKTIGEPVGGVVYYEPALIRVTHAFTQLTDKDKGYLGSAPNACTEVIQKEEVITVPDYKEPRVLLHKPSWFATSEFNVSLNNGLLTGLTSKSTPQTPQLIEQVVGAYSALAAPAVAFVGNGQGNGNTKVTPPCNSGPVIRAQQRFTY